jgi:hypothetical protein
MVIWQAHAACVRHEPNVDAAAPIENMVQLSKSRQ